MKRLIRCIPLLLFFLAVAAFGCFRIIDTDLWLYLRAGEYICRNLSIPRADIFSYTAPGRPWVDVHWLAQAALYLVDAAAGPVGLSLLRLALVLSIFGLLYRCCRAFAGQGIVIAVLTLSLLTANDRFLIKPSLFSLLLATAFICILERSRVSPRRAPYILVPLQAVWANVHPSFFIGPLLILLYLLDALLRPPKEKTPLRSRLTLTFALATLSCLVNPYGALLFVQPWHQLSTPLFRENIIPWTHPSLSFPVLPSELAFRAMLAVCIVSIVVNARRLRPAHILTAAIFGYLACTSRRHMALFALLCAPGICYNLAALARAVTERAARASRLSRAAVLIALCLTLAALIRDVAASSYYERQRSLRRFGLGKSLIAFPDAAADFLESSGLEGRLFCNYDIGSFIAGRFHPRRRVFIDGRNLVYGEDIFRTYLRGMSDVENLNELAEEYGVSALLLTHNSRDVKPVLRRLWESDAWRLVFADDRSVVFFKERAGMAPPPVDLSHCAVSGIPSADRFPVREMRAGELFFTLGLAECARELFLQALERYPDLPEACNFLGVIAMQEGDVRGAGDYFRRACSLSRSYAEPHINLSTVLLEEGDHQGAEREAARAAGLAPANARAHGALGLALMQGGSLMEAERALGEAARLDPEAPEYRNNIGTLFERQGDLEEALDEYEKASALSENYFAPRFNSARLHAKRGEVHKAVTLYLEAIAIDPWHAAARRNLAALYALRGEWEKARAQLRAAARADPTDRELRKLLRSIDKMSSNKKAVESY